MTASVTAAAPAAPVVRRHFNDHRELLDAPPGPGPLDECSIEQILARLPTLPVWPQHRREQLQSTNGARTVLAWLLTHPGTGWQDRWVAAGYQPYNLYLHVQQVHRPEMFARIREAAPGLGLHSRQLEEGLRLLAKIVLHTGRDVDQLSAEDIFTYRAWSIREGRRNRAGIHLSWTLLREVVDLGEHVTLRAALRLGQRPTAELVDRYGIRCAPIRQVLIRYLDERRPGLDHGSFVSLVSVLVRNFWIDIEHHHPGIDTLRLPHEVAEAWKLRMTIVTKNGLAGRQRKSRLDVLMLVRAFYLDIAEWALEDPGTWAPWAVPSPVRRGDLAGMGKQRRQTTAAMHQRIRERLPHLPVLADTAAHHRTSQAAFLHAATATADGHVFEHEGRGFRRTTSGPTRGAGGRHRPP